MAKRGRPRKKQQNTVTAARPRRVPREPKEERPALPKCICDTCTHMLYFKIESEFERRRVCKLYGKRIKDWPLECKGKDAQKKMHTQYYYAKDEKYKD